MLHFSASSARPHPTSLNALLPLLILALSSTASAAYAVLGIDLGTNFIKAAIVKPGTPLDIVLTKDSKRKEAAVVGFKPSSSGPYELGTFPERLYGSDALAVAGRFPADVYQHLKPLLGFQSGDSTVVDEYKVRYPAIQVDTSRTSPALSSPAFSAQEQPWSIEELLAMQLKNIRVNAEAVAGKGSKVTEAVITVPSFYTADERKAVERAADLAGLNVMALIPDGLAVGIDYAVKRDFPNISRGGKAETHLVFDMGASSTTATVLRFQSRDVKDVGKFNKTIYEVSTLGTGWDRTLGGNALNALILDHLVTEFVKKPQASSAGISAVDVKKHGRTASKLWREAERARQVLSANTDVRSSFEGLYDDIDFATKITRSQFEDMASGLADRVQDPIQQALDAAKLTVKDLDSIILFGGALRTPFVQKRLEALAGKSVEIRSNVNADESAAFGAAFKAAGLSPAFRVKDIRDAQSASYAAGYNQQQNGKNRQQQVFVPTSSSSVTKQIQFKDKDDFAFTLYQKVGNVDREVRLIETGNLTASVKALNDKFGCAAGDVTTTFTFRLSPTNGIPEVASGAVSCKVEGTGKKGGIVDSVKGLFGGKKDEQEPLKDEASTTTSKPLSSTSSSKSASSSASTKENETAKKDAAPVIRTEIIPIAFTMKHAGAPLPSEKESTRITERLAAFDRSDKARIAREEAYNTLEGFTYRARDLLSDVGFETASTQEIRDQITTLLSSTGDWLYGEGATATVDALRAKLKDLKSLTDPVQRRQKEALKRPESLKKLETSMNSTRNVLDQIVEQLVQAAASASETASSVVGEAASTVSSAILPSSTDDLDDLEEKEDPASSTTSSQSPKASVKKTLSNLMSGYTEEDFEEISTLYESVSTWLKEKTELQEKLPSYEDAALSIKDIEERASKLNAAITGLVEKKVRAKRAADAKKWASSKTKSAKSAASSVSSEASATVSSASSAVSETLSSASSAASQAVSGAADAVTESVGSVANKATDAASQATESIKSAASKATESAKSMRDEL